MATNEVENPKGKFGTLPVFMTTLTTILGAILFLRFGYAVGHVGLAGTLAIIAIAHMVTLPTALAVAEIATNQRVEGGGLYYIISRSFGLNIGGAIGVALYLSQAIGVAFYVIACAEAFTPVFEWMNAQYGLSITDKRFVSIPLTILVTVIMLTKGASLGLKTLYGVAAILFLSLILFFAGTTEYQTTHGLDFLRKIPDGDGFFYVFAIIFPAFTGMAAGAGLSGDLKKPKKSIPKGTIWATLAGMLIYVAAAFKLNIAANPDDLANDQLVMTQIAVWGPIIPIGLVCATLSSALGSTMVAPRTLQAIALDRVFGASWINDWMAKTTGKNKEPINAALITSLIALFFVSIGNVNFVAEIISMFFMVTYGAICLISFLHHFAADPAYRPSFRSKWFFSLIGAVMCFYLMFEMNAPYALASLAIMVIIYFVITRVNEGRKGLAKIFQGVIFQLSRKLQVFLQKVEKDEEDWRPSIICISQTAFKRTADFDLIRWLCQRYGFGTYIHFIKGYLSKETHKKAKEDLNELIKIASEVKSNVYLDTMISPSYTTAIAQALQLPSISGKEGNMFLFEFSRTEKEAIDEILNNIPLVRASQFDLCVLSTSEKGFGFKREIHIWLTPSDYQNANLMVLMGYIIMGHSDWNKAKIKIYAIFPDDEVDKQRDQLKSMAHEGRLPIMPKNIQVIAKPEAKKNKDVINEASKAADLVMVGFRSEAIKQMGAEVFEGYKDLSNILFVNAQEEKEIK